MHEMSLARSLLEGLEQSFPDGLPGKPRKVNIKAGLLAQVNPVLLSEAFDMLTRETPWEDTDLNVDNVQPYMKCSKCGTESEFPSASCPECGSRDMEVFGGEDLVITQVTFDNEDSALRNKPSWLK